MALRVAAILSRMTGEDVRVRATRAAFVRYEVYAREDGRIVRR